MLTRSRNTTGHRSNGRGSERSALFDQQGRLVDLVASHVRMADSEIEASTVSNPTTISSSTSVRPRRCLVAAFASRRLGLEWILSGQGALDCGHALASVATVIRNAMVLMLHALASVATVMRHATVLMLHATNHALASVATRARGSVATYRLRLGMATVPE